jgi:hypothetical protein
MGVGIASEVALVVVSSGYSQAGRKRICGIMCNLDVSSFTDRCSNSDRKGLCGKDRRSAIV